MNANEIQKVLLNHRKWLMSRGKKGEKADLYGANLRSANLRGADLQGAMLKRADLQRADLEEADLRKAVMEEANLQYANLRGADFRGVDLQGVDLQGADMLRTDLRDTVIKYTNLKYIKIDRKTISQIPEDIVATNESTWFVLDFENFIVRTLELPPEYHQAGIALMNYFGTVLRKKLPEARVKTRIEQYNLKITMTIDPLKGDREVIENILKDYGKVITGKIEAKDFADDRFFLMDLKHEIRAAIMRIETRKEIMQFQRKQTNGREIQIEKFFDIMEKAFQPSEEAVP